MRWTSVRTGAGRDPVGDGAMVQTALTVYVRRVTNVGQLVRYAMPLYHSHLVEITGCINLRRTDISKSLPDPIIFVKSY